MAWAPDLGVRVRQGWLSDLRAWSQGRRDEGSEGPNPIPASEWPKAVGRGEVLGRVGVQSLGTQGWQVELEQALSCRFFNRGLGLRHSRVEVLRAGQLDTVLKGFRI